MRSRVHLDLLIMENMRGGGDVGGYFGAVNQMEMLERCVKLRRFKIYLLSYRYIAMLAGSHPTL